MARKKDNVWYVGALTNWDERDMEIDLSFLENGQYNIESFEDGINANKVAKDYKRKVSKISTNEKLKIHMASGGGFALKIWE